MLVLTWNIRLKLVPIVLSIKSDFNVNNIRISINIKGKPLASVYEIELY